MVENKGQWSTFIYEDGKVRIIHPRGENKTQFCAEWCEKFDGNRIVELTADELDARQKEIDEARDFKWTNPYNR